MNSWTLTFVFVVLLAFARAQFMDDCDSTNNAQCAEIFQNGQRSHCCIHFGQPQCYSTQNYTCYDNILCPTGTQACGNACYDPNEYSCSGGALMQGPQQSSPCNAAGNIGGLNCSSPTACCGSGTMEPSCLPLDNSKKCCQWYLASTQCNATQSCCGSLGAGASSYAFCCAASTTCCSHGFGSNTCCNHGAVCCGIQDSISWCCNKGHTCGTQAGQCH